MAGFDPDAYLADKPQPAFDPDAYLGTPAKSGPRQVADIGEGGTAAMHFTRHGAYGLGDKMLAALAAVDDVARRDKNGNVGFNPLTNYRAWADAGMHALTPGDHSVSDAYSRNLAFNDQLLNGRTLKDGTKVQGNDEMHQFGRWVGNLGGIGLSMAAPIAAARMVGPAATATGEAVAQAPRLTPEALRLLAKAGAKFGAVTGGMGAFGADRSDTPVGTAVNTGIGTTLGGLAGYASPYVADFVGRGASYLGEKAKDLGGWLKVNSIHPTPTLGEAMAEIPGGAPAVGRELLERNIGGLTKAGTARQIEEAFGEATGTANELAGAFDKTGAKVDVSGVLKSAQAKATKLLSDPSTEEAGQRLQKLIDGYAEKYAAGTASAVDALASKRGTGALGFGARRDFKLNGNPVSGDFGAGARQLERGFDGSLDSALGPEFEQANLLVRRLGGAKQAADRGEARTLGNHVLGILPYLGAAVGAGAEHAAGNATPQAMAYGLGALLLGKYGAQAGARTLYSPIGGTLSGLGGLVSGALPASSAAAGPAAGEEAGYIAALIRAALARRNQSLATMAAPQERR